MLPACVNNSICQAIFFDRLWSKILITSNLQSLLSAFVCSEISFVTALSARVSMGAGTFKFWFVPAL